MYDVFVISDDVVGEKMAGPGIRAWEITRCLSQHFKVILGIPDYSPGGPRSSFFANSPAEIVPYAVDSPSKVRCIAEQSRIILTQGYILSKFPFLKYLPSYLVVDIYVPFALENLFIHRKKVPALKDREFIHLNDLRVLNEQLICGDYFLCASERQKHLFTGSLMALNRISPEVLDRSPSLDGLIAVVPFGISEEEEDAVEENVIRNVIPQVHDKDILFLWGGVLSDWFDPLTLIRAFGAAVKANKNIKLLFLSTGHPNPLLPEFDNTREAMELASSLNLTNKYVFFNREWVDYKRRGLYFKEADIGVSIHALHFETTYSFRTRILDYLKYELPVLCTEGDTFSEVVKKENLGRVVSPENEKALTEAILLLAENKEVRDTLKQNIRNIKGFFSWERVAQPLISQCHKVLSGEGKKRSKPSKKDIMLACGLKEESLMKRTGKKYIWKVFQKLPFSLASRIRRVLRFMS